PSSPSHYSLAMTDISPPFIFLLLHLPPRSTLFPYTTLFRSDEAQLVLRHAERARGERMHNERAHEVRPRRVHGVDRVPPRHDAVDRKSTRLNSSHQIISYAVFCLKKKKNTNNKANDQHITYR